jgi:Uma2 family endonuclease
MANKSTVSLEPDQAMSLPQPKPFLTPVEYLRIERESPYKSEYFKGEMFAMAGGSARHSLIIANLVRELGNRLKGRPCMAFESNLRIRVAATGLYTYPDASVVCGELEYDTEDTRSETITNPTVIAEVLSPTTEAYDRGKKFRHYGRLETLKEYLLISQETPAIERFYRNLDGTWTLTTKTGLDQTLELPSIGITISLAEIFDRVQFEPGQS